MTENITAGRVAHLIDKCINAETPLEDYADFSFCELAETYLAKCEEADRLQSIIDSQQRHIEMQSAIIDKQRSALNMASGFIEEVSAGSPKPSTLTQIEKALALTATKHDVLDTSIDTNNFKELPDVADTNVGEMGADKEQP